MNLSFNILTEHRRNRPKQKKGRVKYYFLFHPLQYVGVKKNLKDLMYNNALM